MNKKRMLTVNCSFCGAAMDCPESMKTADHHVCEACCETVDLNDKRGGKVRIDIPLGGSENKILVNLLTDYEFPHLWKDIKQSAEKMTRRQLAEVMYAEGAYAAMDLLFHEKKRKKSRTNNPRDNQ